MEPASDAWRRGALSFRQRFVDDAVFTLPSGRTVSVCQAAVASKAHAAAVRCDGKAGDGRDDPQLTGGTVWDGAYVLASHLCRRSAWTALRLGLQLEARSALRVLELGAGTGLAGLVAATALDNRCSVTLSDLEGVSKLLAKNVERSGGEKDAATLRVATYAWGDADAAAAMGAPFDCVIGADLAYRLANVAPLLRGLAQCVRAGGVAVLALDTSHCPEAVASLRRRAEAAGMRAREVPPSELVGCLHAEEVVVLELWMPG